jgi:hypothetical protein
VLDRDICQMSMAAQKQDPKLCKDIKHPVVTRICSSVLLERKCSGITDSGLRITCEAALKNEPGQCGKLHAGDVSLCYTAVAIFNGDLTACDRAPDDDLKALCYSLVGSCGQLTDQDTLELCRQKVVNMVRVTH